MKKIIGYENRLVKGIFAKQKLFKITAATPAKIAEAIIENVKKNS